MKIMLIILNLAITEATTKKNETNCIFNVICISHILKSILMHFCIPISIIPYYQPSILNIISYQSIPIITPSTKVAILTITRGLVYFDLLTCEKKSLLSESVDCGMHVLVSGY